MSEIPLDDQSQSHYEISLTAGQAFVAFVLMLLSLAASFAFGLMIGKGQADERLVVRKDPSVVTEASVMPAKKTDRKVDEIGVASDDFKPKTTTPAKTESAAPAITETAAPDSEQPAASSEQVTIAPVAPVAAAQAPPASHAAIPQPTAHAPQPSTPAYAQLLSTENQKTAETLAAKLIDKGFTSAYVERGANGKGQIFRVRVKFNSDAEAHAAEAKLREFSKEVWITAK